VLNEFIRNNKPPEVVEAARREQREKKMKPSASEPYVIKKSEIKTFFVQDAENAISVLKNVTRAQPEFSDEEIKLYTSTVHGMKSALANIGEMELSGIAFELEKACDNKNLIVLINEIPVFIDSLQSIVDKFKPREKESDIELSDDDIAILREKLLVIKSESEAFNKTSAKAVLEDLRQKEWPGNVNNALDEIALHILHSAFKKIADVIDSLLNNM
jgi:HPt (histidine-containing phosphotransfer) domain-containing protein